MRKLTLAFLGAVALAATLSGAFGQGVNTVSQPGLTTGYLPKVTYSSSFFGLVPVTTAGTDQVCITGSASKTIKIQSIKIWGTTATATQNVPLLLLKRVTADTGGTAASTTANPGITTQIAKRDPGSPAATATLISYTAAPTVNDSAPTYVDSAILAMPIITSVEAAQPIDFNYARDVENFLQPLTLSGAAMQACVNNAVALTNASAWNGVIVWTEE